MNTKQIKLHIKVTARRCDITALLFTDDVVVSCSSFSFASLIQSSTVSHSGPFVGLKVGKYVGYISSQYNRSSVSCKYGADISSSVPPSPQKPFLGNQKLIPHNGHNHIQEEREVGRLAFASEIVKPYHIHNSTQSTTM